MRRARVLVFLLLVAAAAAAYFGFRNGWEQPSVPGTGENATASANGSSQRSDAARPTFDVVRAEPTGDLLMAGRAEPGWTVTVESNGKQIGKAVADANGEWVIQPTGPVAKGEHSLQLRAQAPKGDQMLFSKQRLAVSLGGDTSKSRPLVALTEEGEATRVLQMSPPAQEDKRQGSSSLGITANIQTPPYKPTPAEDTTPQVSFTSVDLEQGDDGKSVVFLSGRGTPGSRLMLYMNNEFAGTVTVDATGSWTFKAVRGLPPGSHALRADSVDLKEGKVLARAEVNFDRQGHGIAVAEVAPTPTTKSPVTTRSVAPAPDAAPAERSPVKFADNSANAADAAPPGEGVIIVRRGDTLWHIAHQRYGNGKRFTEIFQNNRGQIRNPNLIYPSQRFSAPR